MALMRNIAGAGLATLASRLLGFLRDVLVAAVLGAGPVADAFVVAFRLPSLVRRLLAEGAVNTAFVPIWEEERQAGRQGAFVSALCGVMYAVLFIGAGLALLAMPAIVSITAPGFAGHGGDVDLAVLLARIMALYCFSTPLVAIWAGLLNAHGRVVAATFAPALISIAVILAVLLLPLLPVDGPRGAAIVLACGVLAGGVAQLVVVRCALARRGIVPDRAWPALTPAVKRFFRLAVPGIVAAGIAQVNAFVGLVIASASAGAVTWLYFADRLYQLPLGVISVAIGVALLPEIARHAATGDRAGETAAFSRAAEAALFLSLPAALGLAVAAWPICAALFGHGAFTPEDVSRTAQALALFALGLPAFVTARLLQPLFFARLAMRGPFLIALAGVAADIALSLALFPRLGHAGIALAAALSGWLNALLLAGLAWRQGLLALDPEACRRLPRLVAAAAAMALVLMLGVQAFGSYAGAGHSLVMRIAALGGLVGGSMAVYGAACHVTGALRLTNLRQAFRSR